MSLPTLAIKTIDIKLPVSKKKIKIRPFTVKEQKSLLLAVEQAKSLSKDEVDKFLVSEFRNIIERCIMGNNDLSDMILSDFMYICFQLRSASVGESVKASYRCPCGTPVEVEFDMDKIKCLNNKKDSTKTLEISDGVFVTLGPLRVKDILEISKQDQSELIIETIAFSIRSIADNETVYDLTKVSLEELKEFVGNFPMDKIEEIKKYFDTTPHLVYQETVNCPDGQKLLEVTDIQDFFH